ncbi:MAG: squalene synthase [Chitinophagales bacterium]|nr:squalene synthase [Chitinophagales bacterium]
MILDLLTTVIKPSEFGSVLKLKLSGLQNKTYPQPLRELAANVNDREFCYAALHKVSRSFAVVIQNLPGELQDAVCVFYLVLRGLDSIEDDMNIPLEKKLHLLRNFHQFSLQPGWNISNTGDKEDYRQLLESFQKVVSVYLRLKPSYRMVIDNITKQMGHGMADFAEKKVQTTADYDLYCHYVAGLVGIGLSGLFSASGFESALLEQQKTIANSMGLLLQKTNIVRDYFEDIESGRTFWPEQIWSCYAEKLEDYKHFPESKESLACLNHLVTDALQHVPDCIAYMKQIQHPKVFRFCAIPQVMAMATLAKIYNNPDVFRTNVKIRKGLAARLMLETNDLESLNYFLEKFTYKLMRKLNPADPNYLMTKKRLHRIIEAIDETKMRYTIAPDTTDNIEQSVLF